MGAITSDPGDRTPLELDAELQADANAEQDDPLPEWAMAQLGRIRTMLSEVVAVEDLHPHLRQITVGGGDLATFAPLGPDTFLYLLAPPPGSAELTIDQSFTWEQFYAMPEADRPVGAYYTVRRWRPEAAEIDLVVALHGEAGNGSAWAAGARAGGPVALWGPRSGYHPPDGCDRLLLVADETGLPAAAGILEQLPDGMIAEVVAEVADATERQELPSSPSIEVHWLHRDGAPAGTTTLLPDAVRALPWRPGRPYVWGGAESRAMTAVRRYVRDQRGLSRDEVSLLAYWRHDVGPAGAPEPD